MLQNVGATSAIYASESCVSSSSTPCRLAYPLLPGWTPTVMYFAFAVALIFFILGIYRKSHAYGVGLREIWKLISRLGSPSLWTNGIGQKKILRTRFGGLMHSAMFYGIAALTIGTILVGIDIDLIRPNGAILLYGSGYLLFEVLLDTLGLVFVIGVLLALWRKTFSRPKYVGSDRFDISILIGMLYLGITGFVLEGFRLTLIPVPWSQYSPVGDLFSRAFVAAGVVYNTTWVAFYQAFWWVHALVAFALIASIPYTKFFHAASSIPNMVLLGKPIKGRMSTPFDLMELTHQENPQEVKVGFSTIGELTWDRKAMLDSCTNCGRCETVCPATAAGRDLSPRTLVQELKSQIRFDRSLDDKDLFQRNIVREEEQWACTTCYACVQECPVSIRQLDFILDLRRYLVSINKVDERKSALLSNLARNQNPYGFNSAERGRWANGLGVKTLSEKQDVEYLYWVGCICSFDERAQRVARAFCKILQKARISFAILGSEEFCNGDPARRLGEEGRFQDLVFANIQIFRKYNVKKIVTSCPHCFNTLKNEYPVFGSPVVEVIHHSQLISKLIGEGKIVLTYKTHEGATFHDACYAGRYNDLYEEPRNAILAATANGIKEMHRHKDRAFCCGAGGSNYWYKVQQQTTISGIRYEEARNTKSTLLATECPFCLSMFEDASRVFPVNSSSSSSSSSSSTNCMKIRDIAEIVAENL
jgi:Fe-S oxidoreductase/nitrate reductase gamma subunit